MTKRKPDNTQSIRIEMQTKERELLEQAILGQQVTTVIDAMAKMDIMTMYGWLTILEAFGIIDTPIPTITDLMNDPEQSAQAATAGAMSNWAQTRRENREAAGQGPSATGFYEGNDSFWVTRLFAMIINPSGN